LGGGEGICGGERQDPGEEAVFTEKQGGHKKRLIAVRSSSERCGVRVSRSLQRTSRSTANRKEQHEGKEELSLKVARLRTGLLEGARISIGRGLRVVVPIKSKGNGGREITTSKPLIRAQRK